MLTRRTLPALLFLILLFGIAVARLFVLRFEKGDIYPPYSTFRADPLGGKAFYGALQEMEGLQVSRNVRSLKFLPEDQRPVVLYFGMPRRYLDYDSDMTLLDQKVRAGARLVIAFQPEREDFTEEDKPVKTPSPSPTPQNQPSQKAEPPKENPSDPSRLWKVKILSQKEIAGWQSLLPNLEPTLTGHTHLAFDPDPRVWKTLYTSDGKPVMIERTYGLGSLVLVADSWVFSNEALRTERCPKLLASVLGGHSNVVFDETHFGVQEQPGVSTLARRYHLHAAFAVCILLGLLFVWRHASPLVPPSPATARDEATTVSGQDAATGLTNLLRRSVSPKDLATVCLQQWSQTPTRPPAPGQLETAQAIAADSAKTPLQRFQTLAQLLTIHVRRP